MPKKQKRELKKNYGFMIEPSLMEKVDYYSEKVGVSRSELIRNMVGTSLDDMKILEKTGALKVASQTMNFLNVMKSEKGIAI